MEKIWGIFLFSVFILWIMYYFKLELPIKEPLIWLLISSFVILSVCYGAKLFKATAAKNKYLHSDLYKIDRMTGIEFEQFLKVHFQSLGYKVKITPETADYGADLVISRDGIKTIVQAKKRYKEQIGVKAIQEVVAAVNYYEAKKSMVITNSYFTSNAKRLAKANGVELWDRNKLLANFPALGEAQKGRGNARKKSDFEMPSGNYGN